MSPTMQFLQARILRYSTAKPEMVSADAVLADLPGWGSLPALQLLAAIEEEYGVDFEVRDFLQISSLDQLARAVDDLRRAGTAGAAPSATPVTGARS